MTESLDIFNYLAVLFSIILGLAVTEILQGFRRILLVRRRLVVYWPAILWGIILLVVCAQTWWALFGLHNQGEWTFGMYGIVLIQTALLYMVAGLALSGTGEESAFDMRSAYFDNARPFFMLLVAMIGASVVKDLILSGHLSNPVNLVFHGVFALAGVIAATTQSHRYHWINASLSAILMGVYVIVLFNRIG